MIVTFLINHIYSISNISTTRNISLSYYFCLTTSLALIFRLYTNIYALILSLMLIILYLFGKFRANILSALYVVISTLIYLLDYGSLMSLNIFVTLSSLMILVNFLKMSSGFYIFIMLLISMFLMGSTEILLFSITIFIYDSFIGQLNKLHWIFRPLIYLFTYFIVFAIYNYIGLFILLVVGLVIFLKVPSTMSVWNYYFGKA